MKAEVRGRLKVWRVWYQDESGMATRVQVYDMDGFPKGTVEVGAPTDKLVEAHFEGSRVEAIEYAYALGALEVSVHTIKASHRDPAKAKEAREARARERRA